MTQPIPELDLTESEFAYLQNKYEDHYTNFKDFSLPFDPRTHVEPTEENLTHLMVYQKDFLGVYLTLKAGANPNHPGDMSITPLSDSLKSYATLDISILLIRSGASLTALDEFYGTPLDSLLKHKMDLSKTNHPECKKKLILDKFHIEFIKAQLGENSIETLTLEDILCKAIIAKELGVMYLAAQAGADFRKKSPQIGKSANKLFDGLYSTVPQIHFWNIDKPETRFTHGYRIEKELLFWARIFARRKLWNVSEAT